MLKLFIILLFLTTTIYASIGEITKSLGDIYIIRDMKSQKANVGDKILVKDLLFSRSKSKVQITFIDETVISIGQKSTFLIEDYLFDENDAVNSRCSFKFSKGSFRSVSGKIGKIAKENFKLQTKNANISIKGTVNSAFQYVNGDGVDVTITATLQGATEVRGKSGERQFVRAGMANNVFGNGAALIAFRAPPQLLEAFRIAFDTTTSQTPNITVFSSISKINKSSGTTKGGDKTPLKTTNMKSKSFVSSFSSLDNITPRSILRNSFESANLSSDLDNEDSWGIWGNISPESAKVLDDIIHEKENDLETLVQGLINDTTSKTLIFQGDISGSISNGASIMDSIFGLELRLGGGTDNFTANIDFLDSNGDIWNIDYKGGDGSVTSTSFSGGLDINSPLNVKGPEFGPLDSITDGNIQGSYTGTNSISGVKGTWNATTFDEVTASGTFQGNKQ